MSELKNINQKGIVEGEQLLQLIMDNIPQYIFWKDLDSVYLGCNQNFAVAAGKKSPEELIGLTDFDMPWKREEAEFFREIDRKVMDSGEPMLGIEEPLLQASGRQAWLITNKIPLKNKAGEVIGILGTFEDITKRKENEEALKNYSEQLEQMVIERTKEINTQKEQIERLAEALRRKNENLEKIVQERTKTLEAYNEELLRSNHDLEQFAYIASHDLQEPLRMVGNFVQLLERRYKDKIDENGRSYIQFAVEGVSRMSSLINSIMEYSLVGRRNLEFEQFFPTDLINNKLLDLKQMIDEKKAKIEINDMPEKIIALPNQLGIVFYNLINNALKFNKREGPIVYVSAEESTPTHWVFSVCDNGIGILPEYKDKVFQIFKRLNKRDEFEGNGIGLAMCKRIIELHNGKIWFTSSVNQGSTFYFSISKNLNNLQEGGKVV